MRLAFVHVDDEPGGPEEEAVVIVPGTGRLASMVPLDALGLFLPIVARATADLPEATCACCGGILPTPSRR